MFNLFPKKKTVDEILKDADIIQSWAWKPTQTPSMLQAQNDLIEQFLKENHDLKVENQKLKNDWHQPELYDEKIAELTKEVIQLRHLKQENVDFTGLRTRYSKDHRGWNDNPADGPLTFREASRVAYLSKGSIVGTGKYKPPELGGKYKGATVGTSPAYGCSAQIAEVTVDEETGQITVDRITDAHDCGLAINVTSVEGQMEGSVSMGLGEALFEEVKFDNKGHVINADLAEYKIPTMLDMPQIKTIIVESNEPNGPFGAKEVGEGAIMPTIPAILNAVYDAIGVRIHELPMTPERVYLAIQKAKKGKKG